jgi:ubiquinone/menaquinone biosynthesis C-methylase UbiE
MGGLYTDLAEYYDATYSFKDYRTEAARIAAFARQAGRSGGREWLDVACGTGRHLEYLSRRFHCTGVDASPQMLRVARRRLRGVRLLRGDMRSFRLGTQFDVLSCLFSGIGHVRTVAALRQTIRTFAKHLKPGGVLLFEPWFSRETWIPGMVHLLTTSTPDLKIARMSFSSLRGNQSILEMHYLVGRKGRGVQHAVVTEYSGLFDRGTTLRLLREAGLKPRYLHRGLLPGRGLFIAVRPAVTTRPRGRRSPSQ